MFTGIVRSVALLTNIAKQGGGRLIEVKANYDYDWQLGASVALNGICLTVTNIKDGLLSFELSEETLSLTTAAAWQAGNKLNLEPSLRVGDALDGHWVTGHIDGKATITTRESDDDASGTRFRLKTSTELMKYIAPKGSVSLDGVSLTVNKVEGQEFEICIIPWTKDNTNFKELKPGDELNLEADIIARYVLK